MMMFKNLENPEILSIIQIINIIGPHRFHKTSTTTHGFTKYSPLTSTAQQHTELTCFPIDSKKFTY